MPNDGGEQRKRDFRTAVEDVKAIAKALTTEAEFVLGRKMARFLGVLVLVTVVIAVMFVLLNWYVAPTKPSGRKDLVLTLAQILGGTALLLGLYFTWRGQQNAQVQLEINRRGHITERFTRAIDQLGSENLEIQLGGIYSLERTAYEDRDHHWPVMQVLTAYVRLRAPRKLKEKESQDGVHPPELDIQAILTVLSQRSVNHRKVESGQIDLHDTYLPLANLHGTYLQEALLQGANLREADLGWSKLQEADLSGANLQGADLSGANLQEANLYRANLYRANLSGAILQGAIIYGASLQEANLFAANLQGPNIADLFGANLERAIDLRGANLRAAKLGGANLSGADLSGANLQGADLQGANVTDQQLAAAQSLQGATMPDGSKHS